MIKKIVFLGAPSTGKSTLSEALAERFNSISVPEYGREYWIKHQVDRRLSPEQLLHIAQVQNQWEDQASTNAKNYLFCDTNAFTTWHFACHYHTTPLPELTRLAEDSWQRYDLVVLCDNDIPYDDTWERSGDANRSEFQQFLKQYLVSHGIPFVTVSGDIESRIAQMFIVLEELEGQPTRIKSASVLC
jgi:NadR type nicotinamide-nucleotide adenylyltransferase